MIWYCDSEAPTVASDANLFWAMLFPWVLFPKELISLEPYLPHRRKLICNWHHILMAMCIPSTQRNTLGTFVDSLNLRVFTGSSTGGLLSNYTQSKFSTFYFVPTSFHQSICYRSLARNTLSETIRLTYVIALSAALRAWAYNTVSTFALISSWFPFHIIL